MAASISLIFLFIFYSVLLLCPDPSLSETSNASTVSLLMTIKASLDPGNLVLSSWSHNVTDPCSVSSFEGIACNDLGQVVNISLQGKGLYGKIPPEIGQLNALCGLYLHFNNLHGVIPKEIASLTQLSDLYLNMNDLSGFIPPEIGTMPNLQGLFLLSLSIYFFFNAKFIFVYFFFTSIIGTNRPKSCSLGNFLQIENLVIGSVAIYMHIPIM